MDPLQFFPPSRAALYEALLRVHEMLYRATRGWIGHGLIGVPTLLLTTSGRRTGKRRVTALIYARVDDDLAVVASNGGRDASPGWLHNLVAHPHVRVQVRRCRRTAVATVVPPGHPRYASLLAHCDAVNHGRYSTFQERTARPIPVVVLTPLDPPTGSPSR